MKTSIKVLIALITIMVCANILMAQNTTTTTGIYLTEQDYKANKLSYVLGDNDRLRQNAFLNGKNVVLTYQGKKVKLSKNEIYGYRQNGTDFRFFNTEAYQILDTVGFMLYSHDKLVQKGKGNVPVAAYYYSVNGQQPVMDLTVANLWKSFPAQSGFRYSVRSYFRSDADLISYDRQVKMYMIKYLFLKQGQEIAAR